AVEQKPATRREDRRVVRHARLPTPYGTAGLRRDRIDAANLVLARREAADIGRVVAVGRRRRAIGPRFRADAHIAQRHEERIGLRAVSAHWPIAAARIGG